MGKLKAGLYSLGAAGRLGGHRRPLRAAQVAAGPMWHKDLLGLGADDHAQYALLAGRALGQLLIGGQASGEHLTLQSTAHASRGYVRAQDDLQLLSNTLRGSDGVARLGLAAASPHIALTGDLQLSGHLGLGVGAVLPYRALNLSRQLTSTPAAQGASITVYGHAAAGAQATAGVAGAAVAKGTPTLAFIWGLNYSAQHDTPSPTLSLVGLEAAVSGGAAGAGAMTSAWAVRLSAASWAYGRPGTVYGLDIAEQGHASVTTAYGIRCSDQSGVTVRLLELGPATPYLRVAGGGAPPANASHLHLNMGGTLKNVTEYSIDTAGAGFRALRVPN